MIRWAWGLLTRAGRAFGALLEKIVEPGPCPHGDEDPRTCRQCWLDAQW